MFQGNTLYLANVKGTITVPADVVTIKLSVQSNNNNSTIRSTVNTALLNKAIDALKAIGVNKTYISSDQYTGVSTGQYSSTVCNKVNNSTVCRSESSSKNVLTSTKVIKLQTTDQVLWTQSSVPHSPQEQVLKSTLTA